MLLLGPDVLTPAAIVGALASVIVVLAVYIRSQYREHQKFLTQQIVTQQEQLEKSAKAREQEKEAFVGALKDLSDETREGFAETKKGFGLTSDAILANTRAMQEMADAVRRKR